VQKPRKVRPVEAVQYVEETADPMLDEEIVIGEDRIDLDVGHGRLNCWKALLSAANGGLSLQKTPYLQSQARSFVKPEDQKDG
jgi:hypothetical protein